MRGPKIRARVAAIPMLFAIAAVAAGCGSGASDVAKATAAPTTTASTTTKTTSASPAPAATAAQSPATQNPATQNPADSSARGRGNEADVPRPLVQVGVPCPSLNAIGNDDVTGVELVCARDGNELSWAATPATKVRAIGEPCEPKLEAVAWSTAGVELMCADRAWVLAP